MAQLTVIASFGVEGFHQWEDAPDEATFLRARHRHIFQIEVETAVTHANRQIEIISLRRKALTMLTDHFGDPCEFGEMSCEAIADFLLTRLHLARCKVMEDGENGAVAYA